MSYKRGPLVGLPGTCHRIAILSTRDSHGEKGLSNRRFDCNLVRRPSLFVGSTTPYFLVNI